MSELLTYEPGLRDGEEQAIHDARVATRRIREALRIVRRHFNRDELDEISRSIRKTGSALGDVRDADVLHQLLSDLGNRLPFAASATASVRAAVHQERALARRRLIKAIDRIDLATMQQTVSRAGSSALLEWRRTSTEWKEALRQALASRAADLRAHVHRNGGVYFPHRSHSVRLAVKKLRYTMEIADATGFRRVPSALRHLKRVQSTLGETHDRQVLIERLAPVGDSTPTASNDLVTLVAILEGEVHERHRKYVSLRDELMAICESAQHVRPTRHGRAWLAASVALPSLLMLGRSVSSARRGDPGPCEENIRIRVLMQ